MKLYPIRLLKHKSVKQQESIIVGCIGKVNQQQARLVLGWVTLSATILACNQPPRSTQPGHPSTGRHSGYQWKLGHMYTGTPHHALAPYLWSQCKLVSGWGLRKWRSAPPSVLYGLGKTFTLFTYVIAMGQAINRNNLINITGYKHQNITL